MNIKTQNQEQFEAEQLRINKERKLFMKSLSVEDKNKFKAVEKAVNILVKNNVFFYLFPMLPHDGYPNGSVWQWNSLNRLTKFDKNDLPTKESQAELYQFQQHFIYSLYNFFLRSYSLHDKTLNLELDKLKEIIYYAYYATLKEAADFKELKESQNLNKEENNQDNQENNE